MKKIMHALTELAGLASVGIGVWLVHPPSALIVIGVAAVVAVEVRS